jgi:hypothetical protein
MMGTLAMEDAGAKHGTTAFIRGILVAQTDCSQIEDWEDSRDSTSLGKEISVLLANFDL